MIALAIAASQCNGDPGDPEVRLGVGELQFVRPTACGPRAGGCPVEVLTDHDLTNPYYNWSIGHEQLTSVALANGSSGNPGETYVDRIPLDEAPNIEMRYRSTAPFNEQDEVLVFSLDPEEFYARLSNHLFEWVESSFSNPDLTWINSDLITPPINQAATLAYPPSPTSPLFSWTTVSLPTSAFFFGSPAGPGALPDGSGSVKAARVVQHGRCSTEQLYFGAPNTPNQQLLVQFLTKLDQGVFSLLGSTTSRQVAAVVPFLHQTEDREDTQWGGFFIAGEYTVGVPVLANLHVRTEAPFLFNLVDGIASLTPLGAITHTEGFNADVAHFTVDEFLDTPLDASPPERLSNPSTVATAFYQAADDAQGVMSDKDKSKAMQCTMREVPPANRSRTISFPAALTGCELLIDGIDGAISTNAAAVSPPLTATEQQAIRNVLEETVPDPYDPSQRVYKNFRCNPTFPDGSPVNPTDGSKGVCEVVARAKRINTYPDALELVFFDDEREVTAEAYGLFIFLGGDAGAARGNDLCSRLPVAGGALHSRQLSNDFLSVP